MRFARVLILLVSICSFARQDARTLTDRASGLMASNNAEAEVLLRSAIALDPTQAKPFLLLGLLLEPPLRDSILELSKQVLPLYNQGLALSQNDAQTSQADLAFALELKARLLSKLHEPEESRILQERARAIRQKIVETLVWPATVMATSHEVGQDGIRTPRILRRKEPDYSEAARLARHNAKVVLSTIVDTNGKPTQIELLQPAGFGLDEQAVKALQHWRFEPTKWDGQPVAAKMKVEFNFSTFLCRTLTGRAGNRERNVWIRSSALAL